MMETKTRKRILDIYKEYKSETPKKPLFSVANITYPDIEGNESNFLEDYSDLADSLDLYTVRMYGSRWFEGILSEELEDLTDEWDDTTEAVIIAHLDSWARLYYALSLKYNPLWNVDGKTTYLHGTKVREEDFAKRTDLTKNPLHEVDTTEYATAYNSGTESETGKVTTSDKAHNIEFESGTHKDTFTDQTYTDTETREGNIGVTSSMSLLSQEWEIRKNNFFRTMIKTIIDECGCYYKAGE